MIAWLAACAPPTGTTAEACGSCHVEQYEAWSTSAHAASGAGDLFRALLVPVGHAWGDAAARRCEGCHQPGFGGDVGIGCVACHAATGNRTESDGALVVDLGAPLAGPHGDPAPHETSDRPFLRSSSLCATCHEVTGPGLLDERTGTEHAASGVRETCADCHFPDGSHATVGFEPGPEVDPVDRAERSRGLLDEALDLRVTVDGDRWRIEVENVGAGHDVPTGAAVVRELRLDLVQGAVRTTLDTLGPRAVAGGDEVALLTDAVAVEGAGLARGEPHTTFVPAPEPPARVELVFRPWREVTTAALSLEPAPEIVVASAAPDAR